MRTLERGLSLGLVIALTAFAGGSMAQEAKETKEGAKAGTKGAEAPARPPRLQDATFGGGCFWCTEAFFERIPGVKNVVSGYSGGHVPNPTYEAVTTGLTGHAEVIQITYDPAVISFEKLLDFFWAAHDPTTVDAQGPDHGPQYRSIILYHDEDQKRIAENAKKTINASRGRRSPVVTQIVPFQAFYPAEGYHQDFARNNPNHGYVEAYIVPKMSKLKAKLKASEKAATESGEPTAKP